MRTWRYVCLKRSFVEFEVNTFYQCVMQNPDANGVWTPVRLGCVISTNLTQMVRLHHFLVVLFFFGSGLSVMVVSIGVVMLEMVSIATGEASLFLGQSLPRFLGSEVSRVWGFLTCDQALLFLQRNSSREIRGRSETSSRFCHFFFAGGRGRGAWSQVRGFWVWGLRFLKLQRRKTN